MKRIVMLLLVTAIAFAPSAYADGIISRGELLTLDRAIQIGLKMHPGVLAGQGSVAVNEAKKQQAGAGYWPSLDAAVGYSRIKPASGAFGGLVSSDAYDQFSAGITARQMIYDFGKTATNVSIQSQNIEASRAELENTEQQISLNVKQAYYNILRTKRNRTVARETVEQFQLHLERAKAFFEVGTKPKFDVTKAEVDLSSAKLNLIKADNAVRLAVVALNNAMGATDLPEYEIEDNLSFSKYIITLQQAVIKAYDNRPQLQALTARRIAAEKAVYAAKTGYFPALTGNLNWTRAGDRFDDSSSSWTAGMTLSIPIFNGFLTRHQVSEAEANLGIVKANEEALRQSVFLEVNQIYLSLVESEERIATAEITVRQAKENHKIASGRYAAGVGNPIEVTDAEVALSNAKAAHIQALYDYKVAVASLEKAIGKR